MKEWALLAVAPIAAFICISEVRAETPQAGRQILQPDGKPAAGVKVTLCKTKKHDRVTITSDQKGFCSVGKEYAWKSTNDGGLSIESVAVLVDAPGMALTISNIGKWVPFKGEPPEPLYLASAASGFTFSGKVLSSEEKPVANAEVTLVGVTEGSMAPWHINKNDVEIIELKTHSLKDGSFNLRPIILDTPDHFAGGMGCIVWGSLSATADVNGKVQSGVATSQNPGKQTTIKVKAQEASSGKD